MDQQTRCEIVAHAVRWANNMLTEVLGNHGAALSDEARNALRNAVMALPPEYILSQKPK